jgi:hypothetical protein
MKSRNKALIVAVVAIVVVVTAVGLYSYSAQQQRSKECSESAMGPVAMFGRLSLPYGSTGSNLTLTVTNTTCSPIVGVLVVSVQPSVAGVSNATFVEFDGNLVSASSPLPAGQIATGSLPVTGIQAGQKYTLLVTVQFSGIAPLTETMEMYPES